VFDTKHLPPVADVVAPDGSDVRILLGLSGGTMAHFALAPDSVSVAIRHRTVEEIWFFVSGRGEMWRRAGGEESTVAVGRGDCVTIPRDTEFQFRAYNGEPLTAVGVTMPPWPGAGEAIRTSGPWAATVAPGPGLEDH
jgi:mannose-6-phosphate isomerase-like protein (cupin superfamily)